MISLRGVRFTYPGADRPALDGVDLDVAPAERVLVAGASGSGKSTLLRSVNGLVPHFYGGRFGGRVVIDGMDTRQASPRQLASRVGTVFQDSQARFLTGSVLEEVEFSLELAGTPPRELLRRMTEVVERMGLAELAERRPDRLSAGERARLGIAAALGRDPAALVLDEPVTHLDPEGARAVVGWIGQLCREDGLTALLAEHRLEAWRGAIDRAVFIAEGHFRNGTAPRTAPIEEAGIPGGSLAPSPLLRAQDLRVSFDGRAALDGVDLTLGPGEVVGLVGRNGSGKTTLLRCLAGLQRPDQGKITLDGAGLLDSEVRKSVRIGYVPQPPSRMLFADTVRDEVALTLSKGGAEAESSIEAWIEAFGLTSLSDRHPRDLSAGERQRVALAAVLVDRPRIVLLDEPTLGMDRGRMTWLRGVLQDLGRRGCSVVVATHDAEFVAEATGRAILLDRGRIVSDGPPAEVLGSDPIFRPTPAPAASAFDFAEA